MPEKSEATGEDQICWECDYSSGVDGVLSKQEIVLYSHCTCTKDTCSRWADRGCQDVNGKGFCTCWCFKEDVELTFTYTTDAAALVDTYGDQNAQVVNNVQLNNVYFPNGVRSSRNIDSSKASVPLSGAFSKERTEVPDEDNDYKVEYTITVNEMMEHLESLQSITIDDTMTSTLAFLPDTLKIYKENKTTSKVLVPFEQYTLAYQPNVENEKTGELENLLKITLKAEALGPYKYTLVYQAAVSGGNAHYTYSNKASVELFAQTYDVGGKEYKVPKAAITGSHYGATLYKYDSHTGLPLGGVEFGLYEEGKTERIHLYTTGSDGIIQVETDTTEGNGVYLGIHKLYYLKEEKAPDGYQLDGTKYYFWFCDNEDSISCSKSNEFGMPPFDGKCIYTFQADPAIYDIMVSNKPIQDGYELPETGGSGTTMLYIGASVIMTSAAIILYKKNKRRKGDAASS